MDKARSKHGSAHHHRWNWQCWNRLPGVSVADGIVEFVEKLCLRFEHFDDSTQFRLQGDNSAAELTVSSNMGKEHFRVGYCQGRDICFVFPPGWPERKKTSLKAKRKSRRGASFVGLGCAPISATVFNLSPYAKEWLQTDHERIGFAPLFNFTGLPRYGPMARHSSLAMRRLLRRHLSFAHCCTIYVSDVEGIV